jgi:hypothetical protein
MFLDDETGSRPASSSYTGLRDSAWFLDMRPGLKCALIGDWVPTETEPDSTLATRSKAYVCR